MTNHRSLFDFMMIRDLQTLSSGSVDTTQISALATALGLDEYANDERTLSYLNEIITKNETNLVAANDLDHFHNILLQRSQIHLKSHNFALAKKDAERAVILKPKFVEAYALLSDIETECGKHGRAEVALRLGLILDPDNAGLTRKLAAIRSKERVHPDVSSRAGTAESLLQMQIQAGLEIKPPLSPLLEAIMTGNVQALQRIWKPDMLGLKHGRVENPLIHFTVFGMQRFKPMRDGREDVEGAKVVRDGHLAIIDFFFDQGARLDERDYAGYTAVMHAAGNMPQYHLLKHLLIKGADPNIKSCFGSTALLSATMAQNLEEIDLLLQYGADPHLGDNDGAVPYKMAENMCQVIDVFHRHLRAEMPRKICARCTGVGSNRCARCRVIHYCGPKCQQEHWDSHKKRCKQHKKSHKRLAFSSGGLEYFNFSNSASKIARSDFKSDYDVLHVPESLKHLASRLYDVYNDEWNEKGNMMLKIQMVRDVSDLFNLDVSLSSPTDRDSNMYAYNEKKTFQCRLDPKKLDAPELKSIIQEKGIGGLKGYFWAFMEKGKSEVGVITDPIHPAQSW